MAQHFDTTHVGSLPRSLELAQMLIALDHHQDVDLEAFDRLVQPDTTLMLPPEEVAENRQAWIDEWLAAMSR